MKLVGAGFGDDVDDSARKTSVFGTGDAADQREFAHRVHSQQDSRLTGGGALPVTTNVHAVHQKSGLGEAGPGNGYFFSGIAGLALGPGLEIADTCLQKSQLGEATSVQGQVSNLPLVHQLSQGGRGGLDQGSFPLDHHPFGDLTNAHADVHPGFSPHRELDAAAHSGLEAGQYSLHLPVAQRQVGSVILALVTGDDGPGDSRIGVGQRDLNPGQDAAGLIADGPEDGSRGHLRPGQGNVKSQYQ